MYRRDSDTMLYREFVTESLRLMGQGKSLTAKWWDTVRPKLQIDPEEVVSDLVSRAGVKLKHGSA